jgi:hypothetical protein
MDVSNTAVDNVIVGDWMLGKVGKSCSPEKARNKQFESLQRMPFLGHGGAIGFAIVGRRTAIFCDEPGEHLAKYRIWVFHPDLFV